LAAEREGSGVDDTPLHLTSSTPSRPYPRFSVRVSIHLAPSVILLPPPPTCGVPTKCGRWRWVALVAGLWVPRRRPSNDVHRAAGADSIRRGGRGGTH